MVERRDLNRSHSSTSGLRSPNSVPRRNGTVSARYRWHWGVSGRKVPRPDVGDLTLPPDRSSSGIPGRRTPPRPGSSTRSGSETDVWMPCRWDQGPVRSETLSSPFTGPEREFLECQTTGPSPVVLYLLVFLLPTVVTVSTTSCALPIFSGKYREKRLTSKED